MSASFIDFNAEQISEAINKPICLTPLRQLLIDFFEFYSNFNFDREIISTYDGRTYKRDELTKSPTLNLPPSILRFFQAFIRYFFI